jgi:excisionase family DNA binding protein
MSLMTVKEAAQSLKMGQSSIYRLVWAGLLNPVKIGRSTRFHAAEVERIAASGVPGALPRTAAEARAAAEGAK